MASSKVFVGNLAFKTTSETLREHFLTAGEVTAANIITRGPRSLGYGFVDFANAADAEKSVALFNQKDLDGRPINVELAKPRLESDIAPQQTQRAPRPPRNNHPRRDEADDNNGDEDVRPRQPYRRQRQPRQYHEDSNGQDGAAPAPRRAYRPRNQQQPGDAPAPAGGAAPVRSSTRGRGAPRTRVYSDREGSSAPSTSAPGQVRVPRERRERKPRPAAVPHAQREASQTTLFVANLPFSVTDDELSEIFSGLKVTKAHVVTKRNGKSKGFGFVEFASVEDQLAALKAKDNTVFNERPLNVKVALVQTPEELAAVAAAESSKAADAAPAAVETKEAAAEPKAAAPAKEAN